MSSIVSYNFLICAHCYFTSCNLELKSLLHDHFVGMSKGHTVVMLTKALLNSSSYVFYFMKIKCHLLQYMPYVGLEIEVKLVNWHKTSHAFSWKANTHNIAYPLRWLTKWPQTMTSMANNYVAMIWAPDYSLWHNNEGSISQNYSLLYNTMHTLSKSLK